MRELKVLSFLLVFTLNVFTLYSQKAPEYETTTDSVYLKTHSPHKATFMSAMVPGMGQIYNKQYWKVPIIYAGFTGLIYYAGYNSYVYDKYKEAYNTKLKIKAGNTELVDKYESYNEENLRSLKDTWRRYRDLMYISMGLLYIAQILDANVDAHLFGYDISEDLSLRLEPEVFSCPESFAFSEKQMKPALGIRCSIKF